MAGSAKVEMNGPSAWNAAIRTHLKEKDTLKIEILDSEITELPSEIFIYGQEVDNKHVLVKDRIFAVATSALQEIDRQLQAEKTKVATLESENATLKTQIADVLQRLSNAGI